VLTQGISVLPNPDLKPEYGFNTELGLKQGIKIKNWLGYADVSFFWMEYWDMIEYGIDFVDGRLGFVADNVSRARIAGYEVSLIGSGNVGKIPVRIQSGYTYNYGVDLNTDTSLAKTGTFLKYFFNSVGTKITELKTANDTLLTTAMLKYRFRHLVKFDVEFDLGRVTLGTEVRYYSFVEKVDDVFEFFIPELKDYRTANSKGAVVYNQRISYDFRKFGKLSLIVNNVTNNEFSVRPARMEPPRSFTVQYRITI
jgi:outer membrane receptor protein involved in Fe transport